MATTGPQQAHSTLIVVCCHAIYIGTADHDPDAGKDEHKDWLIEPFQKGETPTFIDHIKKGVQTLRACVDDGKDALLIYSGGPTKQSKGCQIAEGESYLNVALARNLFDLDTDPPSLRDRIFADRYATDSYQNVLLSVIQYPLFAEGIQNWNQARAEISQPRKRRSVWPEELIIVSHAFKRSRFLDLHLPVIRPPVLSVQYIGIDPDFGPHQLAEVVEGDSVRGYGAWKADLYGTGSLLREKRLQRGWNERAFIDEVLYGQRIWTSVAKDALSAIVRGDGNQAWPYDTSSSFNATTNPVTDVADIRDSL